jgi:hypothetical protein
MPAERRSRHAGGDDEQQKERNQRRLKKIGDGKTCDIPARRGEKQGRKYCQNENFTDHACKIPP